MKTGTCSKCGDEGVSITYRASIPSQCMCMKCDLERKRKLNNTRRAVYHAQKQAKDRTNDANRFKIPKKARSSILRDPITKKPNEKRKRNLALDGVVNRMMWKDRKHACYECLKPLEFPGFPPKWVFSHVHGKGARPDLRHEKENIVLHCRSCHQEWETGGNRETKMPRTLQLFDRISVKYPDNINGRQ